MVKRSSVITQKIADSNCRLASWQQGNAVNSAMYHVNGYLLEPERDTKIRGMGSENMRYAAPKIW